LELEELVMQVAEASTAGDGFVEDRTAAHLVDLLPEVADGQLPRHVDAAVVRALLAGDHAEERGLPRAVRPDQPRPLARIELEGGVDEDDLTAILLADAGEGDHGGGANRGGEDDLPLDKIDDLDKMSNTLVMSDLTMDELESI